MYIYSNTDPLSRRGMVDMRKRFRGNAPLSTGKYDEKLQQLSSGNYDPNEEQKLLQGTVIESTRN